MDRIILLACIGVCVGQTPANTYLSFVGNPYSSGDPRLHGARSADSTQVGRPADEQLREPSDGTQNISDRTIQDINAALGTSGIDRSGPSDRQAAYQGSLVPQSRLLAAARSQGIPASLFIPGLTPLLPYNNDPSQLILGATPYSYDIMSSQNRENPLDRANTRSDSDLRLNPQYSGPSLFSLSAQAAAERRSSLSEPQYQPIGAVNPLNLISSSLQNAVPFSRTSLDEYSHSDGSETSRLSNQNGYIQQDTQDPTNYQFSYDVNAVEKGRSVQFAHEEQRGLDQTAGAYSVLLPDGQRQVVEYTADQDGYRPRVSYADDTGRSTSNGNAGTETHDYGNYAELPDVIAARTYLNGGRQSDSIESRYQPQDARTRPQTHPY